MGAEGKLPPTRHTRKRAVPEPREPRAKRAAGNVAAVAMETPRVGESVHVDRRLDDGSASDPDGPCSAAATPVVMVQFCRHCQKQFRSPAELAQHEEQGHATRDAAF